MRRHDTSAFYRKWHELRAAQRQAEADKSLEYFVMTHCFVTRELFTAYAQGRPVPLSTGARGWLFPPLSSVWAPAAAHARLSANEPRSGGPNAAEPTPQVGDKRKDPDS